LSGRLMRQSRSSRLNWSGSGRQCRFLEGARHPGGWKNYPGVRWGQNAPVRFAWFFGVTPSQLFQRKCPISTPRRSAATMQPRNWQVSGVVARLRSCRKVSGTGRHPGPGKTCTSGDEVKKALPDSHGFLSCPHPRFDNLNPQPSK